MHVEPLTSLRAGIRFSLAVGLAICLQTPLAKSQGAIELQTGKRMLQRGKTQPLSFKQRARINNDTYILGPGDALDIELIDLPELSGNFIIGPDGTLYIPRLRSLFVEGLTVEELRTFLTQEFSTYVRNPQVYVRPTSFRPVRIYVGGEVRRPGYYTLSGNQELSTSFGAEYRSSISTKNTLSELTFPLKQRSLTPIPPNYDTNKKPTNYNLNNGDLTEGLNPYLFPTVFDAIRAAQGITPYTDLAKVKVIRKRAQVLGGGRISTNLNFLSLITEGNESQNIRLFDGDVLNIGRSPIVLRDQLLKAGRTNLTPQLIKVFVTGRVNTPGDVFIPQGSSLNQAIAVAGGTKFLKGKVEFIRFNSEGNVDRRIFSYRPNASADSPNNPILASSDLIRVRESLLSGSFSVFNEITSPFIGIYSVFSLFDGLSK